jgi:type VI secretion system secreted protein Hcp
MDSFLFLTGIPGESQDRDHRDEIPVIGFSWGVSASAGGGAGGGGGSGRADFRDLLVRAATSIATPRLMVAAASGRVIPQARLTVRPSGERSRPVLVVTLTEVRIADLDVSSPQSSADTVPGGDLDDRIVDVVALRYREILMEYRRIGPDGQPGEPVTGRWNLLTGTGG